MIYDTINMLNSMLYMLKIPLNACSDIAAISFLLASVSTSTLNAKLFIDTLCEWMHKIDLIQFNLIYEPLNCFVCGFHVAENSAINFSSFTHTSIYLLIHITYHW